MSDPNSILKFWFQGVGDETVIHKNKPPFNQWFATNGAFDRSITERFELDFIKAQRGEYKAWESSPAGTLALIILFDQFSRNMYRHTVKMYSTDHLALGLARQLIKNGEDRRLQLIERLFAYMPLTHAEDLAVQKLGVENFRQLAEDAKLKNPKNVAYYQSNLDYANKSLKIIEEFGRFPHRNAVLNRSSTGPESAFLKK